MPPVNRNLVARARAALYQMKKDYGCRIDIYQLLTSATDPKTGITAITKTVYPVTRAVVLPAMVENTLQKNIAQIASNREFVGAASGEHGTGTRIFIIDRRDIPTLPELTSDDWIVYNVRKYQIVSVEWFAIETGWVITGRELLGEVPEQIFLGKTDSLLALQDVAVAVRG